MSVDILPAGAYLAWRYVDPHRRVSRGWVYYQDGRIVVVEGEERVEVGRFTPAQVAAAQRAVVDSGLVGSAEVPRGTVQDAAPVTYAWRLDAGEGSVTNAGYPGTTHPAIDRLEEALAELEEEAGFWPLMADPPPSI